MLRDQKGLTLVELLVAVAIAAIVAISVGAFMIVGARSFSSTSSEVNLQYESQLAFNQLQDLVIDTSLGVTYKYEPADGSAEVTVIADEQGGSLLIPTDAKKKKLYLFNSDVVYVVIWDREESRLYYEEYETSIDAHGKLIMDESKPKEQMARMADYITDFRIDLTRLEEKRIVRVDMGFAKENKEYAASYNITMRNKIVVNGELSDFTPTVSKPDGITSPDEVYVEPGHSYNLADILSPVVTSSTSVSAPSQEVRWYMDPSTSYHTNHTDIDVNTGVLVVSPGEDHKDFGILISSRDKSVTKPVKIHLIKVKDIDITYTKSEDAKDENNDTYFYNDLIEDEEFTLTATVSGWYLEQASDDSIYDVTWSIAEGKDYFEIAGMSRVSGTPNSICTCKMKSEGIVTDKQIAVKAVSVRSTEVPYQNEAGAAALVEKIWSLGKTYKKAFDFPVTGEHNFKRGMEYVTLRGEVPAGIDQTKYFFLYYITMTKVLYNEDGTITTTVTSPYSSSEGVDLQWGSNNLKLKVPQYFDPNAEYIYEVVCYVLNPLSNGDKGKWAYAPYGSYDIKKALMTGGAFSETLQRTDIFFNGEKTGIYVPRTFNRSKNNYDEIEQSYTLGISESTTIRNLSKDNVDMLFYQEVNGKWEEYQLPTSNMIEVKEISSVMKLMYHDKRWNARVPSHLRMIPTLKVRDNNNNVYRFKMFGSYLDIYTWNIEVAASSLNSWLGDYQKCYFPCPSDGDFPGVSQVKKDSFNNVEFDANGNPILAKRTWYYPFANNVPGQESNINNIRLTYTISSQPNADGLRYNLTVYQFGTDIKLGEYHCNDDDRMWTKN